MTLPKGFGSGGSGGAGSADVEKMIGRRVENMTGIITLSFIAAWLATFGGTAAGYFYYPWAYPTPSGHYAFIVLTIVLVTLLKILILEILIMFDITSSPCS